jgi:ABC-type phosphate/phosphonate transport system ATPase subunit
MSLLCSLARESGFALFCSMHDREYAYEYFDRVIRIQHGVIENQNHSRPPADSDRIAKVGD